MVSNILCVERLPNSTVICMFCSANISSLNLQPPLGKDAGNYDPGTNCTTIGNERRQKQIAEHEKNIRYIQSFGLRSSCCVREHLLSLDSLPEISKHVNTVYYHNFNYKLMMSLEEGHQCVLVGLFSQIRCKDL